MNNIENVKTHSHVQTIKILLLLIIFQTDIMETFALYFNIIVQFAGILYIAFAFVLCLYKTPKREIYKTYRRSQRFLALNYLVMGTNCLAWCFVRPDVWWLTLDPIVEIMDTSLFLLSAIFLTFFFGNLLGTIKASTRNLSLSLALWLLNTLLSICSLWMSEDLAGPLVRRVSGMVFFIYIFYFMFRLLQVYKHRDRMLDQYFTRDMHHFVHWIYRSILLMIFLGGVAAFTLTVGVVGNIICQVYMISVNCYIVISFINFSSRFGSIGEAFKEFEEDAMMDGNDAQELQPGSVRIRYGYETYSNDMPEQTTTIFGRSSEEKEEDVSAEIDKDGVADKTESSPVVHETRHTKGARLEQRINEWKEEKLYLTDQININDIAERLGTDRRYLSRFINEHYGINFSRWISEMRIEEAKLLMEQKPDEGLEWVALQTGFSSLSYFSKVFSQVVGVSPKKWRALQQ